MRYRHEYKYLIDARQQAILLTRVAGLLQRDPHVDSSGTYRIRSAYLDDINDTCLMDNVSGRDPRSKFRIRYYGNDARRLFLEKKIKCRGMTGKESCPLMVQEYEKMVRGELLTVTEDMEETKKRLLSEVAVRDLHPRNIVTYTRTPFVYPGGNVRITFDSALTSSEDVNLFLTGRYAERPVFPLGQCILEVKWDEVLPVHIKEVLSIENLEWTAFSKYYMCRMFHL